jgi:hypothetical protein
MKNFIKMIKILELNVNFVKGNLIKIEFKSINKHAKKLNKNKDKNLTLQNRG